MRRRLSSRGRPRLGFTLVELLVVITIIGMLMALMFPAIGAVVGMVKLNNCGVALRSLSTAVATFKANRGYFPSASSTPVKGAPGDVGKNPAGYSWIVDLLPYLDEKPMYNGIVKSSNRLSLDAFDPAVMNKGDDSESDRHYSTYPLKSLICPEFDAESTLVAPEYAKFEDPDGDFSPELTNYVALSGTHLDVILGGDDDEESGRGRGRSRGRSKSRGLAARPNGVIYYHKSKKRGGKVADGETHTLMLTETREPTYAVWFDGTTAWVVGHDPNSETPVQKRGKWKCEDGCQHALNVGPSEGTDEEAEDEEEGEGNLIVYRSNMDNGQSHVFEGQLPWSYGPSSEHVDNMVNHVYADTHVQRIQALQIDATTYMWLITRNGGEQATYP